MRPFVAMLALTACTAVHAASVVDLTADNFDRLTRSGEWMVEFYAPWCGHCKKLAPIWEDAASSLSGSVNFGKIDCTKYRSLASRFGINGYPTIYHINAKDGAKEVRKAALQHTYESIHDFALSGWKNMPKQATLGYDPMSKAKFNFMLVGDFIISLQQPIADTTGLPLVVVQFSFVMLLLLGITGIIIGTAVWLGPRKHSD